MMFWENKTVKKIKNLAALPVCEEGREGEGEADVSVQENLPG